MILKRKVKNAEDRAKDMMKAREKQRKKMIRTRYGQAAMKHSKKGVSSCMYSIAALLLLLAMLAVSYITKGKTGVFIGVIGLATIFLSLTGFRSALKGFKERDKNYITCKVGAVCSGILLLGLIIIFFRGLF